MADGDHVCPRCSTSNPASAAWRDCGYVDHAAVAATFVVFGGAAAGGAFARNRRYG